MHPFVRDLYKRVIHIGRDYPTGLPHVRAVWKKAIQNPSNCPSCYNTIDAASSPQCQEELFRAVNRGRFMVKEMIGVVQLKKFRAMKRRYDDDPSVTEETLEQALQRVEKMSAGEQ
jgi:hypothetical protein